MKSVLYRCHLNLHAPLVHHFLDMLSLTGASAQVPGREMALVLDWLETAKLLDAHLVKRARVRHSQCSLIRQWMLSISGSLAGLKPPPPYLAGVLLYLTVK